MGDSLDHTISYTRKGISSYNVDTGEQVTVDTTYSDLKVPISFIRSEEEAGQEMRESETQEEIAEERRKKLYGE